MGITRGFGVDIGGSGIKGGLVDLEAGALDGERLRITTPQPSTPEAVADVVADIVAKFEWTGPVGITLPCVVKHGVALTAANVSKHWVDTDARALFAKRLGSRSRRSSCSTTPTRPGWRRCATASAATATVSWCC